MSEHSADSGVCGFPLIVTWRWRGSTTAALRPRAGASGRSQGLSIALVGEGTVHWLTIFSVGLFPVIVLARLLLARKEENEMLERFAGAYRAYRSRVPMFLPGLGRWRKFLKRSGLAAGANE